MPTSGDEPAAYLELSLSPRNPVRLVASSTAFVGDPNSTVTFTTFGPTPSGRPRLRLVLLQPRKPDRPRTADAASVRALPKALSDEAFWFRAAHFTGEKARPERWKHCVDLVDGGMKHALGQAFGRRYFPDEAKALSLVKGIQGTMGRRLGKLSCRARRSASAYGSVARHRCRALALAHDQSRGPGVDRGAPR